MPDSPNIAVVVLDTMRYDSFDAHFDWLPGASFTNAYSTSHWTVPAHASLFTGLYPSEVGVHSRSQSLDCEKTTIAEDLKAAGYRTTKYTANLNIHTWDSWDRGFDVNVGANELRSYYDADTVDFNRFMTESDETGVNLYLSAVAECFRSDCSTVYSLLDGVRRYRKSAKDGGAKSSLRRLKQTSFDGDEFLFVNVMDVHVPYYPPEEYRTFDEAVATNNWEPFVGEISNLPEVKTAYEDAVEYLSDAYRELFAELRDEFDYVVTLSDHGEMLGEYGMVDHAYGVYPQESHVPLVISGPDIDDTTVDTPVSLLDVHATVADIAGVDVESRGQSLLRTPEPRDRLVEYHGFLPWLRETFLDHGVSESEYEALNQPLRGFIGSDGVYAFDTHDEGLVKQTADGREDGEDRRERLDSLVADLDVRHVEEETVDVDEAVMSRLDDLGYA